MPTPAFFDMSCHCHRPIATSLLPSQMLLLCSHQRGRTCCTYLLGSVLLQYDSKHHLFSLLVTTISYVTNITGELSSMLLLPSCPVTVASCCCSLFYRSSSDPPSSQVNTSSRMVTFILHMAWHKSGPLIRSRGRSWSEETQSHLTEEYLGLHSEDPCKGAEAGNPSWFPDTRTL